MASQAAHWSGAPTWCEDLLREDAELLPHPQGSSRARTRGEVAEGQGQEATGGCREGERVQRSPSTTWPQLGQEDHAHWGMLAKLAAARRLPACVGRGGCVVSAATGGLLSGFSRLGRLPIPQGQHVPLAPGLGCCWLGGKRGLRLSASSTMGPGQSGWPLQRHEPHGTAVLGCKVMGRGHPPCALGQGITVG